MCVRVREASARSFVTEECIWTCVGGLASVSMIVRLGVQELTEPVLRRGAGNRDRTWLSMRIMASGK
jgi:transcriptional regulator GlxA family with amidase domain